MVEHLWLLTMPDKSIVNFWKIYFIVILKHNKQRDNVIFFISLNVVKEELKNLYTMD